ncbi:MAG: hypothetical protein ACT4QC_16035 [Planctomycetaceae bacterium]
MCVFRAGAYFRMRATVTFCDPDRWLEFTLTVDFTLRPAARARLGWRDGGDSGESATVELHAARCTRLVVTCGTLRLLAALPGALRHDLVSRPMGRWCLDRYAPEIEEAVWRHVEACRRARV